MADLLHFLSNEKVVLVHLMNWCYLRTPLKRSIQSETKTAHSQCFSNFFVPSLFVTVDTSLSPPIPIEQTQGSIFKEFYKKDIVVRYSRPAGHIACESTSGFFAL